MKYMLAVAALPVMLSCSPNKTAETETAAEPMKVIFETDMGNDVDDALAFAMLMRYVDEGKIELLGVSSNKRDAGSMEYLDQLTTWYGHPEIPLGYVADGMPCDDAVNYALKVVQMEDSTGMPLFKRSHEGDGFFRPSVPMYRSLLAAQPDSSVTIVSVGFSTNLAQLLDSKGDSITPLAGRELVAKKVKRLVAMAGEFRANESADSTLRMPEYNVVRDIAAAAKVFAQWPTPVVTSPFELGEKLLYPAQSIINDFGNEAHPVAEAYKAYLPMPYDRPTWDLTSVLYAVEGENGLFSLSEPGFIRVDSRGGTLFTPAADGNRYILKADSAKSGQIMNRLIDLIVPKDENSNAK